MQAVVNRLRISSPLAPDVWERAQAELVPRMLAIAGFLGLDVVEMAGDEVVLVLLGEDEDALNRAATQVGNAWMSENVIAHLAGTPDRQIGRVVVTTSS
jgi:hypothetical protein